MAVSRAQLEPGGRVVDVGDQARYTCFPRWRVYQRGARWLSPRPNSCHEMQVHPVMYMKTQGRENATLKLRRCAVLARRRK